MRLTDMAIDDLHVCAIGEMEDDPEAVTRLHAEYEMLQASYIAALRLERLRRERAA